MFIKLFLYTTRNFTVFTGFAKIIQAHPPAFNIITYLLLFVNFISKDIDMNVNQILENELNEGVRYFRTSEVAQKLIIRLKKKKKEFRNKIKKAKTPSRKQELLKHIKAIDKSIPIIENFREYFLKLESSFAGMSEKERKAQIKSKYDEIKTLFFKELYNVMSVVGENSVFIIAGAIVVLLFAIIFIPGGGAVLFFPIISLIRTVNKAKEKIKDPKFYKELDGLNKRLEKHKRKQLRRY